MDVQQLLLESLPQAMQDNPTLAAVSLASGLAAVGVAFVALGRNKEPEEPPLARPKPLASAAALRSKLSAGASLVEFGDPEYRTVRRGAQWDPALLKPRKTEAPRTWSTATHGTETWNLDTAGAPSAFCRCATPADVQACVAHAAAIQGEHSLCVAGGRHSHLSMLQETLVLDLSLLRSVEVDPAAKTATCGGGCLNGDVNMACAPHGLAFTLGAHPGTGLGGLVLQGGHGALERKTGLSIDSLLSADVVLASGELVTACADTNSELFWALRGGCGNFGVVVSFTFKLTPIGEGGMVVSSQRVHLPFAPMVRLLGWPDRAACIQAFADFAQDKAVAADTDINGACIIVAGGPVIHFVDAYCDTLSESRGKVEALPFATSFGKPVDSSVKDVSYFHDVGFNAHGPNGDGQLQGHYYQSGVLFESITPGAVKALAAAGYAAPATEAGIIITMLGGSARDIADDATAYGQRNCLFFCVIYGKWAPSANAAKNATRREAVKQWVRDTKTALQPFAPRDYGQLSGNTSAYAAPEPAPPHGDDDDAWAHEYATAGQSAYGWSSNFPRLRAAKANYDPKDLFVNTDHIPPAR